MLSRRVQERNDCEIILASGVVYVANAVKPTVFVTLARKNSSLSTQVRVRKLGRLYSEITA